MIDLSTFKNDTARKNGLRQYLNQICYEALVKELGKENVILLTKKLTIPLENGEEKTFSAGKILVNCGVVIDNNGYPVEPVAEIGATVKSWNDVNCKGEDERKINAVLFVDILAALGL